MTGASVRRALVPVLCLTVSTIVTTTSPQFQLISDCTCPGHSIVYRCTVIGDGGFTRYRGSAFNCSLLGNEILLQHTDYGSGVMKSCNLISARSLRVFGNHYESELTVNITSQEQNGQTVKCAYNSGTTSTEDVIGTLTIRITTASPAPPIVQSDVRPGQVTFSWTAPVFNCPALHYVIQSTGCGNCIDRLRTSSTSITCSVHASAIEPTTCRFAVVSVICNNVTSPLSNQIDIQLQVPEPPDIMNIVARYGTGIDGLLTTDIQFAETNSFNITSGIQGSPLYYTITYTESSTSFVCGSYNISAFSACKQSVCLCSTSLPSSCFHLRGDIEISLSATNRLGSGPYNSITISSTNTYVDVKPESTKSLVCTPGDQQDYQGVKSCTILYGQCQQQLSMEAQPLSSEETTTDSVQLILSTELMDGDCYFLNASNGTFTVLQHRVFNSTSEFSLDGTEAISVLLCAIVFGAMTMASIAANIILIIVNRRKRTTYEYDHLPQPAEYIHYRNTVSFDLKNNLWTLLKLLEAYMKCGKNIVDIKIGECNKSEVGRITIECEEDLSDLEIENIQQNFENNDNYDIAKSGDFPYGYEYVKVFPGRPGSLYLFLKGIYDSSQEDDHYCIDITQLTVRPDPDMDPTKKEITLKFNSKYDLPSDWWENNFNTMFDSLHQCDQHC